MRRFVWCTCDDKSPCNPFLIFPFRHALRRRQRKMKPSQKSLDYGIPLGIWRLRFIAMRGSPGSRGALSTRYIVERLSSELIRLHWENRTLNVAPPLTHWPRNTEGSLLLSRWLNVEKWCQPSSTLCSISQDHVPGMMGIFLQDFHVMRELPTVVWIAFVFSWIHHWDL